MADRIPLVISGASIREIPSSDRLDVQGALEVNGHITPGADSAYDIGTSSLKFRDIFLSSGTIHLGGVKLRADGNKLSIQDSAGATAGITAATLGTLGTDDLAEGSTNLFTTAARTRSHLQVTDAGGDGSFAFDSASGKFTYTGPSAAEARAHISVTDAGGDGSAAYNASTGVITYTGPSASEVRAHMNVATGSGLGSLDYDSATGRFTLTGITQANVMSTMQAGTGVGIDSASGTLSIGQAVGTTDSVTFAGLYASGNVILGGNLTVNGTTTTVNSTNSLVADPLIELNTGATSNANDLGFVFERGSTGNNAAIIWDESEDKFKMGTTTATGASTGNMTVATGSLIANIVGNVTGDVTGDVSGTAGVATAVTVSDNESTDESNVILFAAGAAGSGNLGVEADGNMTYNPSTGKITATGFIGALTGDASGTAGVATTVTVSDNENTNENNVILFGAGAAGSGNIGVEADGNMTYNPSTGKITATGFVGELTGNSATATKLATARAIQISGNATGTANFDGSAAINISVALADNCVTSDELASASTLLIKNTAGSTLKTIIGAGS